MDLPLPTDRQRTMRLNNLGMILKWRGEVDRALGIFESVLAQGRALGTEQIIVYALLEVGDVNRILGHYSIARDHLEEALARSRQADKARWLAFTYSYLAELEAALGNTEAEQEQRDALAEVQERLKNEATENRATVLQVSLELLDREQRIERMQMESELQALRLDRSRMVSWLAGLAAILLLVAFWLALRQVRVRSAANRELDQLASTDALTGLFNRRHLIALAEDRLKTESPDASIGLVLIDLDRFKQVNDLHGHGFGDAVLAEVARRIQSVMRGEDVVARWGGEEFLALLPGCDLKTATQVAERLRRAIIETPVEHQGREHAVTATFGVALALRGESLEQGLKRADIALYRGKENGRNRIEVDDQRR
jgi:diguanylate cyclase (GGDEF)-like protein